MHLWGWAAARTLQMGEVMKIEEVRKEKEERVGISFVVCIYEYILYVSKCPKLLGSSVPSDRLLRRQLQCRVSTIEQTLISRTHQVI
jgi:hypothetical protein